MFHNTARGAEASALVYSIPETAKLNNLRPYYYFRHILTGCRSCAGQQNFRRNAENHVTHKGGVDF